MDFGYMMAVPTVSSGTMISSRVREAGLMQGAKCRLPVPAHHSSVVSGTSLPSPSSCLDTPVPNNPLELLSQMGLGASILALLLCLGVYRLVWRFVVRAQGRLPTPLSALLNMVLCLLAQAPAS